MVTEVVKKKMMKEIKKEKIIKRKTWQLKEHEVRTKFEGRVEKLVNVEASNLWKFFNDGALKASDQLYGKIIGRVESGSHVVVK